MSSAVGPTDTGWEINSVADLTAAMLDRLVRDIVPSGWAAGLELLTLSLVSGIWLAINGRKWPVPPPDEMELPDVVSHDGGCVMVPMDALLEPRPPKVLDDPELRWLSGLDDCVCDRLTDNGVCIDKDRGFKGRLMESLVALVLGRACPADKGRGVGVSVERWLTSVGFPRP